MIIRTAEGSKPGSGAERVTLEAFDSEQGVALRNFLVVSEQGVALRNFLVVSGRTVRETDLIVLTPGGVSVVETKGTRLHGVVRPSLNGKWRIGEEEADFAGGHNPVSQARKSAQILRTMLTGYRADPGFVVPIVCVVGDGAVCPQVSIGDTLVADTREVMDAISAAFDGKTLHLGDAAAILSALDVHDVSVEDLRAQGFVEAGALGEDPAHLNSRERRILRKRAELAEQAERMWRASNGRRVLASAIGTAAAAAYVAYTRNGYAMMMALLTLAMAAVFDVYRRRNLDGPRTSGPVAVCGWLLTLGPAAGIGAVAGLVLFTSFAYTFEAALALQVGLLVSLGLAASTLVGRSSFVFPPPMVVERHDPLGKPLGVFYLVDAKPRTVLGVPTFRADEDEHPGAGPHS